MKDRIARLDQILTFVADHPYSTCADIANHLHRRVELIQSDVRILYRAGLLSRRKIDNSRSRATRGGNSITKEYFISVEPAVVINT